MQKPSSELEPWCPPNHYIPGYPCPGLTLFCTPAKPGMSPTSTNKIEHIKLLNKE